MPGEQKKSNALGLYVIASNRLDFVTTFAAVNVILNIYLNFLGGYHDKDASNENPLTI